MTISRRRFLLGAGLGVLWGAVPVARAALVGAAPAGSARAAFDLATATADTFRPHIGSRFRLHRSGQPALDLELTQVESAATDGGRTDSFKLRFAGESAAGVAQSTYSLDHAVLGRFAIFVVPSGEAGVEAVVNHLLA